MAGYKKFIPEALKRIEEKRAEAERLADIKKEAVYEKEPRLSEIETELAGTMIDLSKAILKGGNLSEELGKIKEENLSLSREREAILKKHNLTSEDLKPNYSCKACSDTGYVDGKACSCLISLSKTLLYNNAAFGAVDKNKTFESFKLSFYPETDESGNPIRSRMETIYKESIAFAENPNGKNLLFIGRTGLGKTHISLSIANRLIDKGMDVVYVSAPSMFMKIEKERFGGGDFAGYLEDLIECGLLIIDDLGAEIKTSVTVAALYHILNERLSQNKPIIINTNLSVSELSENYEERIASRIFGSFDGYQFKGNDIRRVIKN